MLPTAARPSAAADSGGGATELGERFLDAIAYATHVHRGQTRHGRPYVAHLLRVAGLVLEDGGSEDEAIGALLHDAVEDQGGASRLRDIRRRYGNAVASIVDSCTDSYDEPRPPWRARKEQYVEHLPAASPSALRVSLADKVDNVRAILREDRLTTIAATADRSADAAGVADTVWYYQSLARMFAHLQPGARADELGRLAAKLDGSVAAQGEGSH